MTHLPPAALNIMRELSHYHYLTKPQMVGLGLAKSVASLENHALPYLAPTLDAKTGEEKIAPGKRKNAYFCLSLRNGKFAPGERPSKHHYMYYLTQTGLDRLYHAFEDEFISNVGDLRFDQIWIPKEKTTLTNEYFHRRAYVDLHISLRQWAQHSGAAIDLFTHDYQGDPNRAQKHGRPVSINMVTWDEPRQRKAKPDGFLGLTIKDTPRLFVIELHNESVTELVIDQLYRNFAASTAIKEKFPDYPTKSAPFVLSVYTDPAIMRSVQKQVRQNPVFEKVLPGLFFAHLDELKKNFGAAWRYTDGSPVGMFQ